ncbi:MAG: hypothetical protein IH830_03570 [Planctomycetes bacterium]|nr:hypothetical protein [Planctomycetota bacterium]
MKNLEEGLEKLQRANRRNRLFIALFVLIALAIAVIRAPAASSDEVPEVIRAHAFEVVDDEGRVLIALHRPAGSANIEVFNRDGVPVVTIMGRPRFGAIATYNGGGGPLVRIGNTPVGTGAVIVYDAAKRKQLVTLAGDNNGGEVRVINSIVAGGIPVCVLRADDDGDGVIVLWDHQMKGRMLTPRE